MRFLAWQEKGDRGSHGDDLSRLKREYSAHFRHEAREQARLLQRVRAEFHGEVNAMNIRVVYFSP
jgi:hypothetical protein